jgi:hypothetical protein
MKELIKKHWFKIANTIVWLTLGVVGFNWLVNTVVDAHYNEFIAPFLR